MSVLLPLAEKTGPCSCAECRKLCDGRPGIFAPEEVEPAAAELGLSLEAFFEQYLTINWHDDDPDAGPDDGWDHLAPGWKPDRAIVFEFFGRSVVPHDGPSTVGRRCTVDEGCTKGRCALLGPTGCRLSIERRPVECRRAYGCTGMTRLEGQALHDEVSRMWKDNPTARELLARLAKYNRKEED